jgi:hypothetical protein
MDDGEAKDNQSKVVDMGLLHSSSAESLTELILRHLMDAGDVEKAVSPNFLIRKWPGFVEWSTKSVRDAFYASPLFPRLLHADGVKETIARGVTEGLLAYVGKKGQRLQKDHELGRRGDQRRCVHRHRRRGREARRAAEADEHRPLP